MRILPTQFLVVCGTTIGYYRLRSRGHATTTRVCRRREQTMVTYLAVPSCQLHGCTLFSLPTWRLLPIRRVLADTDRSKRLVAYVELVAALQSTDRPVLGAAFDP